MWFQNPPPIEQTSHLLLFVPFNKKPHVVRYTLRHGDSARVDGVSVLDRTVELDCELSYMDVDATRSHRSRLLITVYGRAWAIYLSYIDVGATSS